MIESLGSLSLLVAGAVVSLYSLGYWQERKGSSLLYARGTFISSLTFMVGIAIAFAGGLGLAISGLLALVLLITMNRVVGIPKFKSEAKTISRVSIYAFVGFVLGRSFDLSFMPWVVAGIVVVERTLFYMLLRRAKACA